jgi:hypothetical protein
MKLSGSWKLLKIEINLGPQNQNFVTAEQISVFGNK